MRQASKCGLALARALVQVLQNSASQMVVLRFTTLSARDSAWRNPRRKKYDDRVHSNIKTRMSVHWLAQCHANGRGVANVSALVRNRTQVVRLSATSFNHSAIGSYQLPEKTGVWLVIFRQLQLIFWRTGLLYSDFSTWISRPDTKYENSWTQTFDRYILSHLT